MTKVVSGVRRRQRQMSDDWKEQKKRQKAIFTAQQNLPYDVKVRRAELRAREFIQELDHRGQRVIKISNC